MPDWTEHARAIWRVVTNNMILRMLLFVERFSVAVMREMNTNNYITSNFFTWAGERNLVRVQMINRHLLAVVNNLQTPSPI